MLSNPFPQAQKLLKLTTSSSLETAPILRHIGMADIWPANVNIGLSGTASVIYH